MERRWRGFPHTTRSKKSKALSGVVSTNLKTPTEYCDGILQSRGSSTRESSRNAFFTCRWRIPLKSRSGNSSRTGFSTRLCLRGNSQLSSSQRGSRPMLFDPKIHLEIIQRVVKGRTGRAFSKTVLGVVFFFIKMDTRVSKSGKRRPKKTPL